MQSGNLYNPSLHAYTKRVGIPIKTPTYFFLAIYLFLSHHNLLSLATGHLDIQSRSKSILIHTHTIQVVILTSHTGAVIRDFLHSCAEVIRLNFVKQIPRCHTRVVFYSLLT